MYVIYALIDPRDNTVRYVGVTDDMYERFQQHIQCSGSNYAKNVWIMELRAANKMVIMETLEEVENRERALEREGYWIRHFEMMLEPVMNVNKTSSPRKSKKTNLRIGKQIGIEMVGVAVQAIQLAQLTYSAEDVRRQIPIQERFKPAEKYRFSDVEKQRVIDLYPGYKSIDKVLHHMGRGSRWHKHASEILKEAGLL